MNLLVLQHVACEHPGVLRKFLAEDGHSWVPVQLGEGETLPSLDGFDGLWVMGGPMDVWQEDEHPWLVDEKALIREAVAERGMSFLGLCLGHQLLAEALGGSCAASATPEVGVLDVQLTAQGAEGILFDGVADVFSCLQWHGAEVSTLPEGAVCLATSADCLVQAMSWGPRAYSMQFHVELEEDTVSNWLELPAYEAALRQSMGADGPQRLADACAANMTQFNETAERIYINWLQTAAQV